MERREDKNLTSAACDGTASSTIRISLSTRAAIVIGSATPRARHSVPPQGTVAYVPPGGKNTPVALWVHLKFRPEQIGFVLRQQTFGDGSTALRFHREEAQLLVAPAEVDSGWWRECYVGSEDRANDEGGEETWALHFLDFWFGSVNLLQLAKENKRGGFL